MNNLNKNTKQNVLQILIISVLVLSISIISVRKVLSNDKNYFEISKNIDIFVSLYKELNNSYVEDINPNDFMKKGIDAMLHSLDPYTVFIPESDMEDYRFMATGQYAGIGAMIGKRGDSVFISSIYEGFPAQKSDIRSGDVFLSINGKSLIGKSIQITRSLLKGAPSTEIKAKIKRPSTGEILKKNIKREKIHIDNVRYSGLISKDIGYIQFSSFRQNASKEVKEAFKKLKKNHKIKGLVLDLRYNPGGLLSEAVNSVNIFIPKGKLVVKTKGKVSKFNRSYKTYMKAFDTHTPLVVLINKNSASASEIVSGAIQDYDRGVIIGKRSFGKGLVQSTINLSYNTKLKLTISKYYIPSGRCIQALDYSHKDKDGRAIKIPDSLISEYKTSNGRIVKDGAGITPDLIIDKENLSEVSINLLRKMLIFEFANYYRNKNNKAPNPDNFVISDKVYNKFVNFVKNKKLSYETSTDKSLAALKKNAQKDKYFDSIKTEYEAISKKIKENKDKDLITYKDQIKDIIRIEILGRYFFEKGITKAQMKEDKQIQEAIKILNDKERYNAILNGSSEK